MHEQIEKIFSDNKIASLVIAGLRLDEDLQRGLFPSLTDDKIGAAEFAKLINELLSSNEIEHKNPLLGLYSQRILSSIVKKAIVNVKE